MSHSQVELELSVTYAVPRRGLPSPASFRRWVETTLQGRIKRADLALRLVGDYEGRSLNRHYRGKDYATNVLSFPAELPAGVDLPVLGDIVICVPVVQKEARLQGKDCKAHFAHLTVHGVLHLLGFNHEDPREALAMEALERELLAEFGMPDPYQDE